MDPDFRKKIKDQYISEYADKYYQKKFPRLASFKKFMGKNPEAAVPTTLIGFFGLFGALILTKGLILIPLAGGSVYALTAEMKNLKEIEKEVERDIDNGILVRRYQKDVLEPQMRAAQEAVAASRKKTHGLHNIKKPSEDFSAGAQKKDPSAQAGKNPPEEPPPGGLHL